MRTTSFFAQFFVRKAFFVPSKEGEGRPGEGAYDEGNRGVNTAARPPTLTTAHL